MDSSLADIHRLARISACVALRDELRLEQELRLGLNSGISVPVIREVILQTYLFAGYASTINAFIVFNRMVPGNLEFFQEKESSAEAWRKRGEDLCKRIYGDHYSKLIENMRKLHPDLADWILSEGYGKVLARPFLNPHSRELLIVAMTAALGTLRQFESHVRGALHAGATPEELRSVLDQLNDFLDLSRREILFQVMENCFSGA